MITGEQVKFLSKSKDGGPNSNVMAYWLVEIKWLFSVALLRFDGDSREVYHDHAFNSVSWLLSGWLWEYFRNGTIRVYGRSLWPIITTRRTYHRVDSHGVSWVLTFRGPWNRYWHEMGEKEITLTHGRKVV